MDQTRDLTAGILVLALSTACVTARRPTISETDRAARDREFALVRALPKPAPDTSTFLGCGPRGARPDRALNFRKNRTDTAESYRPLSWEALATLPARRSTAYRFRSLWTRSESKALAQYEGAAVMVEGYLIKVTVEMPEPTNCYSRDGARRDWHLQLGATPNAGILESIVVEITPRFRALHPEWSKPTLDSLASAHAHVRISGWTLYDQMHLISRRYTPWEIHPITRIEIQDGGGWRVLPRDSLDDLRPSRGAIARFSASPSFKR